MTMMLDLYMRLEIKDDVIDLLLRHGYNDFFFIELKKYASTDVLVSDEEQVSGRQNYANLRIHLNDSSANILSSLIKQSFSDVRVFGLKCHPLGLFVE